MILIFKELSRTVASSAAVAASFIRSRGRSIKMGVFCILSVISMLLSLVFVGATLALRVSYNGRIIATVRNSEQFEAAVKQVAVTVNGSNANVEQVVKKPEYTSVLVLNDTIDTKQEVAQAIIENTEDIVSAAAVLIDGEPVACSADSGLEGCIEACRTRFEAEGAESVSEFLKSVTVEGGYYLTSELKSAEEIRPLIEAVPVKTTVTSATEAAIPFSTEKRNNSELEIGTTKVITEGSNGLKRTGERITLINGEETERTAISEETVAEPVTRVIEVGTKRRAATGTVGTKTTVSGLIFPLPSGVWQVSAYFGDGRGHRAIDLRSPKGTPIYAVAAGKVIKAGWDGDYGYAIVIDHGNGFQTRYAHESDIFVSVGQTVSAGQEIGAVGKTGNASGNHLHFEILINGTRIDPAPSLGLG